MSTNHIARSASDRDPTWEVWFVERSGLNVMTTGPWYGGKFGPREFCEAEADRLNALKNVEDG